MARAIKFRCLLYLQTRQLTIFAKAWSVHGLIEYFCVGRSCNAQEETNTPDVGTWGRQPHAFRTALGVVGVNSTSSELSTPSAALITSHQSLRATRWILRAAGSTHTLSQVLAPCDNHMLI